MQKQSWVFVACHLDQAFSQSLLRVLLSVYKQTTAHAFFDYFRRGTFSISGLVNPDLSFSAEALPIQPKEVSVLTLRFMSCSRSVPQPIDSHWSNNPVRMRLPPAGVPASYPQMKLPVLDNPALFEKLDTEALFFAFYYMPGTHQQYLAARELKRQSWRYHKQHGAWFQVRCATSCDLSCCS